MKLLGVSILCSTLLACYGLPLEVRAPVEAGSVEAVQETPEESFNRSDGNNDRSLTFDEFLHSDLLYERLKKEEFDGLDANHDGIVTKSEYDTHYRKEKETSDDLKAEYFGQIFEEFDENFDLKLSQEELAKVMQKRFLLKIPANFAQIFKKFDKNNDGGLDINEYLELDRDLDFHQFEPLPQVQSPIQSSGAKEDQVEDVSDEEKQHITPILAFKAEKMPLMKRKFFEKY